MTNGFNRQTGYKSCAFTGYRPQKMPFGFNEHDPRCIDFKKRLHDTIRELIGHGYSHFISGGALGMDMFASEAVLDLKRDYPWIILEIACPFDGQASKWSREYQDRYYRLIKEADIRTLIGHKYTRSCMFRRNRYMVDNANLLLAAYDGQPGGTAMTVEYAENTRVPVQIVAPLSAACPTFQ